MKHSLLGFLLIGLNLYSNCQVINYDITSDGEISFEFEKQFIYDNEIKEITSSFSSKTPTRTIRPLVTSEKSIKFNSTGQRTEFKSSYDLAGSQLEKNIRYYYSNERLIQKIEKDHIGFFSTFISTNGDTTLYSVYRGEHYSITNLEAEDSILINEYKILREPTSVKEFNKKNLKIEETDIQVDSLGLMNSEITKFTFSPSVIEKKYLYNKQGLISQIMIESLNSSKKFEFSYDSNTSLESIKYYSGEKLVTEYEIVYNSNGCVKAILEHDVNSNFLIIERFEYKN